jgi:hypothetical protein
MGISIKSTRQIRTQIDTTQRKTNANNQQKSSKDHVQRGVMAMKGQSTITKKT